MDGQTRSYTCVFCNRGFSNAQALGGHMNIHRRDRARLRQSLEERMLLQIDDDQQKVVNNSNHNKKPWNFLEIVDDHDHDDYAIQRGKKGTIIGSTSEIPHHQFPSSLLVGVPHNYNNYMNEIRRGIIEEKKNIEVDLELRLGFIEPKEAPTLSTREFF
ncbi:hypothetical protein PIB30_059663 [Stylosanthes scabra]|uniref:C2H2-type domain-containing protein n=1 Tax=Stylosanthes scabra TaxID=79078 RepID=A0ABU6UK68_9FABA|nr:hypothetical protein [Stylosanthes scabra]